MICERGWNGNDFRSAIMHDVILKVNEERRIFGMLNAAFIFEKETY